jgi:hypothetical protein
VQQIKSCRRQLHRPKKLTLARLKYSSDEALEISLEYWLSGTQFLVPWSAQSLRVVVRPLPYLSQRRGQVQGSSYWAQRERPRVAPHSAQLLRQVNPLVPYLVQRLWERIPRARYLAQRQRPKVAPQEAMAMSSTTRSSRLSATMMINGQL